MPAVLRIDALRFARSLSDAGMDPRQAEALVRGLSDADTSDFATRADIAEVKVEIADLRSELRTGMANLGTELKGGMADLRAELRGDMGGLKADMFRHMHLQAVGIVGLQTGLTVALFKLLP